MTRDNVENASSESDHWEWIDVTLYREQYAEKYVIPLAPALGSIVPNNMVQLVCESADGWELVDVIVTEVRGSDYVGIVDFVPQASSLAWGDVVSFGLHNVIDLSLYDYSERLASVRKITAAIKTACLPPESRPDGATNALEAAREEWIKQWRGAPSKAEPNLI